MIRYNVGIKKTSAASVVKTLSWIGDHPQTMIAKNSPQSTLQNVRKTRLQRRTKIVPLMRG